MFPRDFLKAQGDAESIHVLWQAIAAVRRGVQQNQGLVTMNCGAKVSVFCLISAPLVLTFGMATMKGRRRQRMAGNEYLVQQQAETANQEQHREYEHESNQ